MTAKGENRRARGHRQIGGFQNDQDVARRQKAITRPVKEAFARAVAVTDLDIAQYEPDDKVYKVGLALLSGGASLDELIENTELSRQEVREVLHDAEAMAWISKGLKSMFYHHAGRVDAALLHRALTGDTRAIQLYYERMGHMTADRKVAVQVSGGINVQALSNEDLLRLLKDGERRLPQITSRPVPEITDGVFRPREGSDVPEAVVSAEQGSAESKEPRMAAPEPRQGSGDQPEVSQETPREAPVRAEDIPSEPPHTGLHTGAEAKPGVCAVRLSKVCDGTAVASPGSEEQADGGVPDGSRGAGISA